MTEKAPSFIGAFVIERVLFSKWIYRLYPSSFNTKALN